MKSVAYFLIFLNLVLSCAAFADEIVLYTSDAKSLMIAKHIYPDHEKKSGTLNDGWYLTVKSDKNFSLKGSSYSVYSWNEINNPAVSSQMDHYNYGGLLVLKDEKFYLKFRAPNQTIKKVIVKGDCANVIAIYSFAQRGNAEEYINVYQMCGNKMKNVFSRQTLESDLMANGTYHMESDIFYRDLNGDGVSDILINEKLYEVADFEKTDRYSVKETVRFIIKDKY